MGCLSSKEVQDASVARSNPAPAGDHGSLVDDEAREKSSASFAAPSSAWGESRPVPQARQFLDDGPGTSSGPPPASRRSAPTVSAGGPGDAPLDSDDELEAQMRPPPGARAAPAEAAAADAEAARREKKAKKKRDKHRVTDLEAHDLEGENPETKTEMLRRRASRRAAETESAAMRVVFGDVDAFSDGDFSPEGSPRKVALSGDGPLITGAAVRRALRPADALGGTLGGASKPPERTNGSAPSLDALLAPSASFAPEPLGTEAGPRVPEPAPAEETPAEETPAEETPAPTDDLTDNFVWRDDEREEDAAPPEAVPVEPAAPDDFVWRDDEREEDAAPPEAAPVEPAAPDDFVWRDDAAPAGDLEGRGGEGGDPETTTTTTAEPDPRLSGAAEDAYADDFEADEVDAAAAPAPAPAPAPPPVPERAPEPAPESEAPLNETFDAADVYAADLGIPSTSAGYADAIVEVSPPDPPADDGWADGGFDDGLEAAGEADVDYDDAGLAEEDDDVF